MSLGSRIDRILFGLAFFVGAALLADGTIAAAQDAPAPAQAPTDEEVSEEIDAPPPIEFEPATMDFGFVKPKQIAKGDVKIWNRSDKPLTILAVQPGCKCTTLNDLSGQEIPVGGYVVLSPQMKAQASPGGKKTSVKILVDGYSRIAELNLKAEVAMGVRANPGIINAVDPKNMTGRIVLESIDGKPFKVLAIHGQAPKFVGYDPAKGEPQSRYLLDYDLTTFKEENLPRYLVVETDHPEAQVLDVAVRHRSLQGNKNFALRPTDMRVNVGAVHEGKPVEFEVEFEAVTADDPLLTVMYSNPDADVKLIKTEPKTDDEGKQLTVAKVSITPKNGHRGMLYGTITFYTQKKEQFLYLFGSVVDGPEKATAAAAH